MCENCNFVVPVNIVTPFANAPFSWAARHTTICLDHKSMLTEIIPSIYSVHTVSNYIL